MVTKAQQAKLDAQAAKEQEATTAVQEAQQAVDNLGQTEQEDVAVQEPVDELPTEEAEPETEVDPVDEDQAPQDPYKEPSAEAFPLEERLEFARADLENLKREVDKLDTDDMDYRNLINAEQAYLTAYVEVLGKRVAYAK